MGLVWFVVLWIGGGAIGGAMAAVIANATAAQPGRGFHEGYVNGYTVGHDFSRRYGGLILLGALGISIAGTATGRLPGTARPTRATTSGPAPSSSGTPRSGRPGSPPARTRLGAWLRTGLVIVAPALIVVGSLGVLRQAAEKEMAELGADPNTTGPSSTSEIGTAARSAMQPPGAGGSATTGGALDVQRKLRARDFHAMDEIMEAKQAAVEQDVRREADLARTLGAFSVADPTLTPLLDAWVGAEPTAWPPRLARAEHRVEVAWQRRGTKFANETSQEQFAGMREILAGAVADAHEALDRNPKLTEAYRTLVVAATGYGDKEACIRLAERAIAIAPATLRVRRALAWSLLPRWGGSYESVAALARDAQRYAGQNPSLTALLGVVDWDRGRVAENERRYEDALVLVTKALEAGEDWEFYDDRAELYRRQNRYTEALADVARALALAGERPKVLARQAMILVPLKRYDDALADVRLASELDPTNDLLVWFRRKEGEAAVSQGYQLMETTKDVPHAIERLTWATEMTPDNADAFYWRGRAYMRTNEPARALSDFEEAVRLNPRHFESYLNIDWLLAQRGDWDGIIQRWTQYVDLEPLNGQAYLERGGAYRHKGDQQAALADARKACELGNRDACQIIGHATARR